MPHTVLQVSHWHFWAKSVCGNIQITLLPLSTLHTHSHMNPKALCDRKNFGVHKDLMVRREKKARLRKVLLTSRKISKLGMCSPNKDPKNFVLRLTLYSNLRQQLLFPPSFSTCDRDVAPLGWVGRTSSEMSWVHLKGVKRALPIGQEQHTPKKLLANNTVEIKAAKLPHSGKMCKILSFKMTGQLAAWSECQKNNYF